MYKRWTEEEISFLKENYGTISLLDLAKHFGTTVSSVMHCAGRNNIKSPRGWSDAEIAFLKEHYQDMTYKELSTHLNRTKSAIDLKINRLGLVKNQYVYTKDFFESIDNESKAYWCGFIMADGCVSIGKNNSCELSIKLRASDYQHLKNFNKALCGNVPVTFHDDVSNFSNKPHRQCQIRLYSEKIVHDLAKYGIVPNKSLIKKFPLNINQALMKHFVRGYYDGNGYMCGSKKSNGYPVCCFCTGSEDFANGLQKFLLSEGIKSAVYRESEDKNCLVVRICGMQNVDSFLHYIYDDATIYLDRKKDKKEHIYNTLKLEQRLDRLAEMRG